MADENNKAYGTEAINNVKELWNTAFGDGSGVGVREWLSALKNDMSAWFNRKMDWLTDANKTLKHDDNIYVPIEQKTLLGQDFRSLYAADTTFSKDTVNTDQGPMEFFRVKAGYDTELRGTACSKWNPVSYDALSDSEKAVYEVTLLSKSYAHAMDGEHDDVLKNSYANMMDQYRANCESKGMSWASVLNGVSAELQAENYHAKQEGNSRAFNDASNAHAMMLTAAPADFQDSLVNAYTGEFRYEDTINPNGSSVVDRSVKKSLGNAVQTGTSSVTNIVGSAWGSIRAVANDYLDKREFEEKTGVINDAVTETVRFVSESQAPEWRDQQLDALTATIQSGSDDNTLSV